MAELTNEELQARIQELEKELEEAKKGDENLEDIKNKYQEIIDKKDNEIKELNDNLDKTKNKVDTTVNDLNDEIKARLEQSEAYKDLLATVEELQHDKAEALVDKYIHEGKLTPAQKENALKLALNDQDTFIELYRDAQPIIDLNSKPKTKKLGIDASRLVDYFKN